MMIPPYSFNYTGQAQQHGDVKPYNGIANLPMKAKNMSLYVNFQRLLVE